MEKENQIVLRCVAFEGKNAGNTGFYAYCIDLSISTWRPNLQAARQSLNDAVCGYIETVAKNATKEQLSDFEIFKRLVIKKAPLFPYRAMYYYSKYIGEKITKYTKKNKKRPSSKIFNQRIDTNNYCGSLA